MTPDALAALHTACFDTPPPWSATSFANLLSDPTVFLIADDHGFVLGRVVVDEAELLTLAVDPAQRRVGIGRRLLDRFETRANRQGATYAFLEVSERNAPAIGLYSAAGWTKAGRRTEYYRTPDACRIDALILSKALAQD